MGDKSKISWTDATWSPVTGCDYVSAGCANCYAARMTARLAAIPATSGKYGGLVDEKGRWNGTVKTHAEVLKDPLKWTRPRRVFVCSMSDLFHPDVSIDFIEAVFAVMAHCQQHTFQVLTKRPKRMLEFLTHGMCEGFVAAAAYQDLGMPFRRTNQELPEWPGWPLPNVWIGVSAENQDMADERVPLLLQCPAAVRWVSAEPLLGPINFEALNDGSWHDKEGADAYDALTGKAYWRSGEVGVNGGPRLDWVVAGGESGPDARPMHPRWAADIRDQCDAAGVAFHFKQWGEWLPIDMPWKKDSPADLAANERWINLAGGHGFHGEEVWRMRRVGKKSAGRVLDGRTHDDEPARKEAAR